MIVDRGNDKFASGMKRGRADVAVIFAAGAALLCSGCAGQQEGADSSVTGPVSAYAKTRSQSSDPKEFRPVSVEYHGNLVPVDEIAGVIAGNTMVIVQPWVNLKGYELRENPIYFRADGLADSPAFININWNVRDNDLCVQGGSVNHCYQAYSDDTGQAFLMEKSSRLLAKVSTINAGDSHHVKALYEQRKKAEEAQARAMMAFAGLLFEALTTPDVVVCERGMFGTTCR